MKFITLAQIDYIMFTNYDSLKFAFKTNVFILQKNKKSQTPVLLRICYLNNISGIKTDSARDFMKSLFQLLYVFIKYLTTSHYYIIS